MTPAAENPGFRDQLWRLKRQMRRRLSVLGLFGVLALTGCSLLFPSRPSLSPVSLNFSDGEVRAVLCLSSAQVKSVLVSYRVPGSEYMTAMESVQDDGTSGGTLRKGDAIVIGDPLGTLRFTELSRLPEGVTFENIVIRIEYTEDGSFGFVWPGFANVDPSRLASDDYVYSDGRVSNEPCGMYGSPGERD